jgi:hypothetical protein
VGSMTPPPPGQGSEQSRIAAPATFPRTSYTKSCRSRAGTGGGVRTPGGGAATADPPPSSSRVPSHDPLSVIDPALVTKVHMEQLPSLAWARLAISSQPSHERPVTPARGEVTMRSPVAVRSIESQKAHKPMATLSATSAIAMRSLGPGVTPISVWCDDHRPAAIAGSRGPDRVRSAQARAHPRGAHSGFSRRRRARPWSMSRA